MKGFRTIITATLFLTLILSSLSAEQYFGNITIRTNSISDDIHIDRLIDHYRSQPFDKQSYNQFNRQLLTMLTRNGYLFASLHLKQIDPHYQSDTLFINPTYRLLPNQLATIDTLIYDNIEKTSPQLLNRELSDLIHKPYTPSIHQTINRRLQKYAFLAYTNEWKIIKTLQGDLGLLLKMQEEQSNSFSGIAGYVPQKSGQQGYFTGQLNINLNNIGGMGRKVSVYWSKMNQNSQELKLGFFSPQVFNTNLFTDLNFEQVLRDTLVVIRNFSFGLGGNMSQLGELSISTNYETTIPTPAGREQLQLSKSKLFKAGVHYSFDNRDQATNPSHGFLFKGNTYLGYHHKERHSDLLTQFKITAEYNITLLENIVLNFNSDYQGKFLRDQPLNYSDMLWYGGATSLRGYPEDFFFGSEIGQLGAEIRWITGKFSRVYAFFDQGGIRDLSRDIATPNSFGVGLRLESRMGLLGIDYAFGEDDTFTTAKIHLLLENKF